MVWFTFVTDDSPLAHVKVTLVENVEDAFNLKRWLGERHDGPVAVDVETGGLSPEHDRLRLVQFGDVNQGWVVPWDDWRGLVKEVLRDWEGELVGHNVQFDARNLIVHAGWQPPWHRMHDTMIQVHLDDPLRPKGLKPASSRLIDPKAAAGQKVLDEGMAAQGWTWATVPLRFAAWWFYAGLDVVLTAQLHRLLHHKIVASCPDAYSLEMATSRIVANMMLRGMKVDRGYVDTARTRLRDQATTGRTWLKEHYDVSSPSSAAQIKKMFTTHGIDPATLALTDGGLMKVDKETLTFYRDNPDVPVEVRNVARVILTVRHVEKVSNVYLGNVIDAADTDDVVRASINSVAARTGRMSVSEPPLQQLPRDDKVVRGSFIPRPGHVLLSCDLDQVEARLAAHFSEDAGLIQAFKDVDETGLDFFAGIASEIFQTEVKKSDPRRQITKTTVYGALYSAGLETMARSAAVSTAQMRPVKEAFETRFPGLKALTDRVTRQAKEQNPPSITSPLGRRFVADRGREYTQMLNALLQGHAAEYLKQCLVNLDAAGLGDALRLPIHDEVLAEVPVDQAEEALRVLEEGMTNRTDYRVPITASGKIMPERWAK